MPFKDITQLLNIQEIKITNVDFTDDSTVLISAEPTDIYQVCPVCKSHHIIRNGIPYLRKVRHLPASPKTTFLLLPAIRMKCKECHHCYVWKYEFVAPYNSYTKAMRDILPKYVLDGTLKHAAYLCKIPYSTAERIYKEWMDTEATAVQQACIAEAKNSEHLILGIDDFAIRKGHNYNTGIHDLRSDSFLDIIPGRTIEALKAYFEDSPLVLLNPKAVIMDLARAYHTFIKEVYPLAIRVADRFHVNRYVTEALHNVRKSTEKILAPHARKKLKSNARILGKRFDELSAQEEKILYELLAYNKELKVVYEWKELFIDWYDLSNRYNSVTLLERWILKGKLINNDYVNRCIKTIENWKEEIANYHLISFTNGIVEGRNNKIKTIQRRSYFLRNKKSYKQRVILECNRQRISA